MPVTPSRVPSDSDPIAPPPLVVAASLIVLEALALLTLGALELANLRSIRLTMGLTTTVFFVAAAAGLGWCAWALKRVRRAARGPAVMAQLIQLGIAWNLRDVWNVLLPGGLALVALVVIAGLLHPDSTRALEEDAG